jgi:hypothetical protein
MRSIKPGTPLPEHMLQHCRISRPFSEIISGIPFLASNFSYLFDIVRTAQHKAPERAERPLLKELHLPTTR